MKEMTLKEIQQVSLDILKDLHSFCEDNNIKYTLCGGTLLGAIRHNGFIPWDDDVDVAMPRPEYEKFISSFKSDKGYVLKARNSIGDTDTYMAYARLCDNKHPFVDAHKGPWSNSPTGVWIDIFPWDGAEDDINLVSDRSKRCNYMWNTTRCYRTTLSPLWKFKIGKELLYGIIKKIIYCNKLDLCDEHIRLCKEVEWDSCTHFFNYTIPKNGMKEYTTKNALSGYSKHIFEDSEMYIMNGYDMWLKNLYGDYMQLPPIEQQQPDHSFYKFYWK